MRTFFEGHMQGAPLSLEEVENRAGLCRQHTLHYQLAVSIEHRYRNSALVHIQADILDAVHQGVPFFRRWLLLRTATIPYSKGAPFYNASTMFRWAI